MVDQIWIDVTGAPARASLARSNDPDVAIINEAIRQFTSQMNALPASDPGRKTISAAIKKAEAFKVWISGGKRGNKGSANATVSAFVSKIDKLSKSPHLSKTNPTPLAIYAKIGKEVVEHECNPSLNGSISPTLPAGKPKRASLASKTSSTVILDKVIEQYKNNVNNTTGREKKVWQAALKEAENLRTWIAFKKIGKKDVSANSKVAAFVAYLVNISKNFTPPASSPMARYPKIFDEVVAKQCGYKLTYKPVINPNGISPRQIRQGQEVEVTINGSNFPEEVAVVVLAGNQSDPKITVTGGTRVSDKQLKVKIRVDADADTQSPRGIGVVSTKPGQAQLRDRVENVLQITPGPTCGVPGKPDCIGIKKKILPPKPTTSQLVSSFVQKHQDESNMAFQLQLRGSGNSLSDNMPKYLRPAGQTLMPNFQAAVNLGSIYNPIPLWGGSDSLANAISGKNNTRRVELLGHFNADFSLSGQPESSVWGHVDLGTRLRLNAARDNKFFFDLYGSGSFHGANYSQTSRLLYSGKGYEGTVGAGVGSNFGTKSFRLIASGDVTGRMIDYDKAFGVPFSGTDAIFGANLTANYTPASYRKSAGVPNLALQLRYFTGTTERPEVYPGMSTTSFEQVSGVNANATLIWPNASFRPFVSLDLNYRSVGTFPVSLEERVSAGIRNRNIEVEGGFVHNNRATIFNDGRLIGGYAKVSSPKILRGVPGLMGEGYQLGNQTVGAGSLVLDFGKLRSTQTKVVKPTETQTPVTTRGAAPAPTAAPAPAAAPARPAAPAPAAPQAFNARTYAEQACNTIRDLPPSEKTQCKTECSTRTTQAEANTCVNRFKL